MRNETPFFTVVIPTFNRKNKLRTSINSVLKQKFINWELLIVDDGSTDGTEELIEAFCQSGIKITYYKRPKNRKKGPSTCRNIGVEMASGEYIAYLDSDDEWLENKLQRDYEEIKSKNPLAIYSDSLINDGKKIVKASSRHVRKNETYEDLIFSGENFGATATYVIKRDIMTVEKFDENLARHEDTDFFIRIGNKYGWTHIKEANTMVNWQDAGTKPLKGFDSMVTFFERYKNDCSNPDHLARYARWAWVCAARFDNSYKDYFLKELIKLRKKIGLRYKIFILFPEVHFFGWKVLRKIKSIL